MRKGILSLALVLAVAALAPAQQVSFKLMGGLSWIDGSDYNAGVTGAYNLIRNSSLSAAGSFKNLSHGPHFQAEVITHISSHLAIGLGGGYYRVSDESLVTSRGTAMDGTAYDATSSFKPQVSVIPFCLNLHYFAALGPKMKLDVYAGPVFSIVQVHIENPTTSTALTTSSLELFTASQVSFGAQAGLGVSYQLTRRISLVADGSYHLGGVKDLLGNWVKNVTTSSAGLTTSSSDAYYMWSYDLAQGSGTYRQFGFAGTAGPTGDGISNARKTKIDISGFMFSAGVRISF
jgi:hypothetical protein